MLHSSCHIQRRLDEREHPPSSHRRIRVRRRMRGDPAEAGRHHRLRHPGEGRRPRRHLARQHLPRLRMRRPFVPLLVLLRAEPRLDPDVRTPGGDLGLHPPLHRQVRPRFAPQVRPGAHQCGLGRRVRDVGSPYRARHQLHRACRHRRVRGATHSSLSRARRPRHLRGNDLPLGRVEP